MAGGTSAAQLEGFLSSVTWELANRAAKAEVPYKHAELLLKWVQMYRSIVTYGQASFDEQVQIAVKRCLPKQVFSPNKQKKAKTSNGWCGDYNTQQGACSGVEPPGSSVTSLRS